MEYEMHRNFGKSESAFYPVVFCNDPMFHFWQMFLNKTCFGFEMGDF